MKSCVIKFHASGAAILLISLRMSTVQLMYSQALLPSICMELQL